MVPYFLLQVSVQEHNNNMVSTTELGGFKDNRDAENNIIINDLTLRTILSPQLNKM